MPPAGAILTSDPRTRLKPCLRCGYALRHLTDARNCPECGLAVRITLANNKSLSWSNPAWQRHLAAAFALLAAGLLCRMFSGIDRWVTYLAFVGGFRVGDFWFTAAFWLSTLPRDLGVLLYALSLCLLTRREGRHPDTSRPVRIIFFSAAAILFLLGLSELSTRLDLLPFSTRLAGRYAARALSWPWVPLAMSILIGGAFLDLAKRATSRLLFKLAQPHIWFSTTGLVLWLFGIDDLFATHLYFWPLRWVIWDWLFPLSLLLPTALTIRLLLQSAREADTNWTSDP